MIPTTTASLRPPGTEGKLTFHIVVDFTTQSFSIDGPETNGVLLHYEVLKAARGLKNRFWEFDVRTETKEQALAEMESHFPGYKIMGTWSNAKIRV